MENKQISQEELTSKTTKRDEYYYLDAKSSNNYLLSEMSRDLSLLSNKILTLIILISKKEYETDFFSLKLSLIEKYLGYRGSTTREDIVSAFEEISKVSFKGMNQGLLTARITIIQDVYYYKEKNTINFRLDPLARKLLFGGKTNYTIMKYVYTYGMKSKYGKRLYELLVSQIYKDAEYYRFELKKIKACMGIQNKYARKHDFEKYTLQPAIKDINNCSLIDVDYRIIHDYVEFKISSKTPEEIKAVNAELRKNKEFDDMLYAFDELNSVVNSKQMSQEKFQEEREFIARQSEIISIEKNTLESQDYDEERQTMTLDEVKKIIWPANIQETTKIEDTTSEQLSLFEQDEKN